MLNNFIAPVSNLVGTWLNNKKEEKQAKHQAKINVIQNDANWEQIMAETSKDSSKDEFWTIILSIPNLYLCNQSLMAYAVLYSMMK